MIGKREMGGRIEGKERCGGRMGAKRDGWEKKGERNRKEDKMEEGGKYLRQPLTQGPN